MIDLHTHSLLSDGVLIPSELVRRGAAKGYKSIAITDHVDFSNIESIVPRLAEVCSELNKHWAIEAVSGAEITHVPPQTIARLAIKARALGAEIVIVHGETLVEPVMAGTNRAALEADIDILAHPGLLTEEEAILAKERGIFLEVSARKGHCLSNGHVVAMALRVGASLVINTDAHAPEDLISLDTARQILIGSGLPGSKVDGVFENAAFIIERAKRYRNLLRA